MTILESLNVVILVPDPCLFLLLFCFVFAAEYIRLMSSFKFFLYYYITGIYFVMYIDSY